MAITTLPPSPFGEIRHNDVREKINEVITDYEQYKADAVDNFVIAGRGGIGINAVTPIGTISAAPVEIEGFDVELISDSRGVDQTLSNNGLIFNVEGLWQITAKVSLSFDESNSGRTLQFRAYNTVTGIPGSTFNFFVGRNQGGVNVNVTIATEVTPETVGDLIKFQILTTGDTYANCSNIGSFVQAIHLSEAQFL